MSGIGLVGASSTGKTTLAKSVVSMCNIPFIPSQVRGCYAFYGYLPGDNMSHAERMQIQRKILDVAEVDYGATQGVFITDRTPIDFAAHVLSNVTPSNLSDEETADVIEYVDRCYQMTNLYFSSLIMLQPAIQIVAEDGRTSNVAFIEHINAIMVGLVADPEGKLLMAKHFIKRNVVDLAKRTELVIKIVQYVESVNMKERQLSETH